MKCKCGNEIKNDGLRHYRNDYRVCYNCAFPETGKQSEPTVKKSLIVDQSICPCCGERRSVPGKELCKKCSEPVQQSTSEEIIKYFYDVEALDNLYCNNQNCHSCDGTDMSGEPNGYGCDAREEWVNELVKTNEYEEIPTDDNNLKLYVSLDDYKTALNKSQTEIKQLGKDKIALRDRIDDLEPRLDKSRRHTLSRLNTIKELEQQISQLEDENNIQKGQISIHEENICYLQGQKIDIEQSNSLRDKAVEKYSSLTDKYCNLVEQNIEARDTIIAANKEIEALKYKEEFH